MKHACKHIRKTYIPASVTLAGEVWLVVWRSNKDPSWRAYKAWGVTMPSERRKGKPLARDYAGRPIAGEIHLCDSLLNKCNADQLADTWLHELCHAALRSMPGRGLKKDMEEKVVRWVAMVLAGRTEG